jgi:hypothetical protein
VKGAPNERIPSWKIFSAFFFVFLSICIILLLPLGRTSAFVEYGILTTIVFIFLALLLSIIFGGTTLAVYLDRDKSVNSKSTRNQKMILAILSLIPLACFCIFNARQKFSLISLKSCSLIRLLARHFLALLSLKNKSHENRNLE